MTRKKKKDSGIVDQLVGEELKNVLLSLGSVEAIPFKKPGSPELCSVLVEGDRVRMLLRVRDEPSWLPVVRLLLLEERRQQQQSKMWFLHVCRQLKLRPGTDVLGFAWNFILRASDLKTAVIDISRIVDLAKSAITLESPKSQPTRGVIPQRRSKTTNGQRRVLRGELTEYPLMASPARNMPEGGLFEPGKRQKGAHLIGGK